MTAPVRRNAPRAGLGDDDDNGGFGGGGDWFGGGQAAEASRGRGGFDDYGDEEAASGVRVGWTNFQEERGDASSGRRRAAGPGDDQGWMEGDMGGGGMDDGEESSFGYDGGRGGGRRGGGRGGSGRGAGRGGGRGRSSGGRGSRY